MKAKTKPMAIRKPTKPFRRLTVAQKRVAIARDVLAQIKMKRFQIKSGTLLCFGFGSPDRVGQKNFSQVSSCRVCAIGAAMLSAIHLFNKVTLKSYPSDANTVKKLTLFFPVKQVQMIEDAFEKGTGLFALGGNLFRRNILSIREQIAAENFGRRYRSEQNRAVAIFKNIIQNRGTFKP